MKIKLIIILVIFYIVSTAISFTIFSKTQAGISSPAPAVKKDGGIETVSFDDTLPKTEACPLNGVKYSKQQRDWWGKHRPLGVMIENHENSRPQSGLSSSDIIYEAVAEGGITRFLALYYCADGGQVGPVRSARTYFLDFVSEYGDYPLYAHVGGANTPGPANALGQIGDYGWNAYNDLNQFSIGFPVFWRDYNRLGHPTETEHTMYSTTTRLWDFAKKDRKLTNKDEEENSWDDSFVEYSFKEDAPSSQRPASQKINLQFWESYSDYFVDWTYNATSNLYERSNGGKPHIDRNNKKVLTAKNIVVLVMAENNANDGYENNAHLLYKTKGSGKAVIFRDGERINGTWKKDKRASRTLIFDEGGNKIEFNRGRIWLEILPLEGVLKVS